MRLRGLLPSLGAGGSLIAAGLAALALVGGVIAFRGWSGDAAGDEATAMSMPGATQRAIATSPSSAAGPAGAAERRRGTAGRRRATTRGRAITRRGAPSAPPRSPAPSPPAPSPPAPTPPSSPGRTPPPPSTTARDDPVRLPAVPAPELPPAPIVSPGTVERVVTEATGTVEPVVDTLPAPILNGP